jgi:hypothetical protein
MLDSVGRGMTLLDSVGRGMTLLDPPGRGSSYSIPTLYVETGPPPGKAHGFEEERLGSVQICLERFELSTLRSVV